MPTEDERQMDALVSYVIKNRPYTINTDDEIRSWATQAMGGKSLGQLQKELQDPFFGINQNNYYDYAADHIEKEKAKGVEINPAMQESITDMMRQQAGVQPLNWDIDNEGRAIAHDPYADLAAIRARKTSNSGWENFTANVGNTMVSQMMGFTQIGARITDAVGATDNATGFYQNQLEHVQMMLSPQGGASGMAGQLVGVGLARNTHVQ